MLDWLSDVVGSALTQILVDVLLAAVTLAAAYAVVYLRRLSLRLQEQAQNDLVDAAIRRVEHLAVTAIWAAEGAVARELRQRVADGKASVEDLREIGDQIVEVLTKTLDEQTRQALEATVGDVRDYIEQVVEAQLEALKAQGLIPRTDALRAEAVAAAGPK